jgi:hypothetical protein
MKVYLIKECDSYREDRVIAIATNKEDALEWVKCHNLKDAARHRVTGSWHSSKDFLDKEKVTLFNYIPKDSTYHYIVDEWKTI